MGRRRSGGAGARVDHGADGVEELGVGEEQVRRRRRSARVAVTLGSPPALAGDRSGERGVTWWWTSRRPRASLDQ